MLCKLVELFAVVGENLQRLFVLALHQLHDFAVDLALGVRGAGKRGVPAEVLVCHRFERDHVKLLAHAVAGYHRAGKLRGLLNVV